MYISLLCTNLLHFSEYAKPKQIVNVPKIRIIIYMYVQHSFMLESLRNSPKSPNNFHFLLENVTSTFFSNGIFLFVPNGIHVKVKISAHLIQLIYKKKLLKHYKCTFVPRFFCICLSIPINGCLITHVVLIYMYMLHRKKNLSFALVLHINAHN